MRETEHPIVKPLLPLINQGNNRYTVLADWVDLMQAAIQQDLTKYQDILDCYSKEEDNAPPSMAFWNAFVALYNMMDLTGREQLGGIYKESSASTTGHRARG